MRACGEGAAHTAEARMEKVAEWGQSRLAEVEVNQGKKLVHSKERCGQHSGSIRAQGLIFSSASV